MTQIQDAKNKIAIGQALYEIDCMEKTHNDLVIYIKDNKLTNEVFSKAINRYCADLVIFTEGFQFQAFGNKEPNSGKVKLFSIEGLNMRKALQKHAEEGISAKQMKAISSEFNSRVQQIRYAIDETFIDMDKAYASIREVFVKFVLPTLNLLPLFELET